MEVELTESDVRRIFGIDVPCCESCHDDHGRGWEMVWVDVQGESRSEPVQVCCAIAREYRRMMKLEPPSFIPAYEA